MPKHRTYENWLKKVLELIYGNSSERTIEQCEDRTIGRYRKIGDFTYMQNSEFCSISEPLCGSDSQSLNARPGYTTPPGSID